LPEATKKQSPIPSSKATDIAQNKSNGLDPANARKSQVTTAKQFDIKTAESAANPNSQQSIAPVSISGIKVSLPPQVPAVKEKGPLVNRQHQFRTSLRKLPQPKR
jgi:hypothetical protein